MKIMVVDDEAVSRDALAELAQAATGVAPCIVNDGRAAWARLDGGEAVGLVLSDIRMPHVDGLALLRRIRADARFEPLPVMLVSTARDRDTVAAAAAAGVHGFVLKPVTHGCLLRVREAIAQLCASMLTGEAEAMHRLGVNPDRFRRYVTALIQQGRALAERLAAALQDPAPALIDELAAALRTQRAVAGSLGARRLAAVLGAIEDSLQALAPAGPGGLVQALAAYRLQLYWLQGACSASAPHAQRGPGVLAQPRDH